MKNENPTRLTDGVREAVRAAGALGVSQYRICQAAGVAQPILTRFLAGERGMEWATAERLAAALGLGLVTVDKGPVRKLAAMPVRVGRPPVKRRRRSGR